MVLTKGGSDTGGTLGLGLSYAEPLALYGKGAADRAADLCDSFLGKTDFDEAEFAEQLVELRNTTRELYGLANLYRSLIVQKARALRPLKSEVYCYTVQRYQYDPSPLVSRYTVYDTVRVP